MKTCSRCKTDKPISEFNKRAAAKDGLHPYCKECHRKSAKKSYYKDIEKSRERDRKRNANRKEYLSNNNRIWRENNKERHCENSRNWYSNNKERVKDRKLERYHEKYKSDIEFRADRIIRRHVRRIFELLGTDKCEKTYESLGYSPKDFVEYISKMLEPGMTWDNYGEWHVDHIRPIKSFISEGIQDPSVINALNNLQPLWASENISKGAKLDYGKD